MSRSFKHQPFMAICGGNSAKQDKQFAHRGERRAHHAAIHKEMLEGDFENFLIPDRLECAANEVYSWNRDGNQMYWSPRDYNDKEWFARMMRK